MDIALKKGDAVPIDLQRKYVGDRDKARDWRVEAKEDFDFVAGRQYSEDELAQLNKKKRPTVIFNRMGPVIDAITGYEIGNRREVRYIPREMGDVMPNELLTGAAQWFNDTAYGDYARSAMFADSIICGMGWTETRIDYSESPEGEPRIDHLDPMEMSWDRDARSRNLADATRVWRTRRIPFSEAEGMFPGFTRADLHASWSQVQSESDLNREDNTTTSDTGRDGYVTIVQCQYETREVFYTAIDPMTQQEAEFSEAEYKQANKRLKAMLGMEMQGVRFRKKVFKQAFLGEVVLAYGPAPCDGEFSMQCVTGKYDRNKGTWYGIVRPMKDPQRWANKWLAQLMFIMNANSKGGLLAEKRAFENWREAERTWSQPDSVTIVEDGAMDAVKEKQQHQFPAGYQQLTEFAISSIRDVSGVSVELLGLREANQAASLEMQRRQSGMNILQWAFDGLKLYTEKNGRVILYYLQNDLSDNRLIKITGKDKEQYVPLMKQATAEYDIIVDDSPDAPNQKEQVWGILQSILPTMGKLIPPEYLLKMLKYSPFPASIVMELEEMAKEPNPQAQQQAQIAEAAQTAEIEKTRSETLLNNAKAQAEQGKGETEMIKAQSAQQQSRLDMQVGEAEFGQTMSELQMKRQNTEAQHTADMQKIGAQMVATQAKAQAARQNTSR